MCCTPLYKQTFKIYGFLHNAWIAPNTLLIRSTYAPYTLLVRSTYAPHRPKVSLLSPHKAEGPSAVSASHTYHLCGSINSAALREKSYNQVLVRKIRRFRVMRHNDFPLKTKPIKPFVPVPRTQVLCPLRGEGM